MSKKTFGASAVYVILGLLFIAIIGLRTISTPEIWTHLAQGKTNAPISYLEYDSPVNTTWLYDKLAYTFWGTGEGNPGLLIILNVLGLLLAFGLLLQVSSKWGGAISQGFALLICGHLIFQTVDVGPQVIMMLFIALFLFVLSNFKSPAILFGALIPLQILWTNMHGSFLFGPLIAGLSAVQAAVNNKGGNKRKASPGVPTAMMGILTGALLLATLANPSLFELHLQVLSNVFSPSPMYWSSLFIEYFQIPALRPLILFVLVLGAGGLITLKRKLPVTLTTLAIIGAFLGWTAPQNSMLFAVLAFPFIVLSLTAISEYASSTLNTVLGKQAKLLTPATGAVLVILLLLSIFPVVSNCAYVKTGSASVFGLGIQDELYPSDCEAVINHPAFPAKIINLPADGGYLAFKYGKKVFLDYRPGRYKRELLTNVENMMLGSQAAYDTINDTYRPEAIIINTLSPSAAQGIVILLMKQIWKLCYFDGTTAILIQDKPQFKAIIGNTEAQAAGLAKLEAARAEYAAKVGKCNAGNPSELIGSGKVFLALNRAAESEAIFSLLLQGNGKIPGAQIGLGNSQLLLKKFDEASETLKVATEQVPNNFLVWASYATACKYAGNEAEHQRAVEMAQKIAERNKAEAEAHAAKTPEAENTPISPAPSKNNTLEEIVIPE